MLVLCILLLLIFTSCDRVEPSSPVEILFAPAVSAEYKGSPIDEKGDLRSFGVYSSRGSRSITFGEDNGLVGFMENVKVGKTGEVWTSDPVCYWPISSDYDVSFFAYTPYIESPDFTANWGEKTISMQYTPAQDPASQADLMVAEPATDKYNETVSLSFYHILTWVTFSANYKGDLESIKRSLQLEDDIYLRVDELEVKNVVGTNSFSYRSTGSGWLTSDGLGRDASYKLSVNNLTLVNDSLPKSKVEETKYKNLLSDQGALFLLPQSIVRNTSLIGVTFSYVNKKTHSTITQFYSEITLPVSVWGQGKKVRYNFTIDVTSSTLINITSVTVEPWVNSGNTPPEVNIK